MLAGEQVDLQKYLAVVGVDMGVADAEVGPDIGGIKLPQVTPGILVAALE